MARKVIVGGFASNERQMNRVAEHLSEFYDEDVEAMSFRAAMNEPVKLEQFVRGATVFTHSAGMLAVQHTNPHEIVAIAPPVPTPVRSLILRAGYSAYDRAVQARGKKGKLTTGQAFEFGKEIALHSNANLGRLGMISTFNAIEVGIAAKEAGIEADIAFMSEDRLFQLSDAQYRKASEAGLSLMSIHGGHEQFTLEPSEVIAEYDAIKNLSRVPTFTE